VKIAQGLCMYLLDSITREPKSRSQSRSSVVHFRELSVVGVVGCSEMLTSLEDRAFVLEHEKVISIL
jgi:hypothetical protein